MQLVLLMEQLVSSCPASPRLLQLLLQQACRYPDDAGWAAWLLPLLIRTCCTCEPPAPVGMWAAVVVLARGVSPAAAAQLAQQAVSVHPWSLQLWQLHHDTAGGHGCSAACCLQPLHNCLLGCF